MPRPSGCADSCWWGSWWPSRCCSWANTSGDPSSCKAATSGRWASSTSASDANLASRACWVGGPSLVPAGNRFRPVQARHPALFQALHRPRGLPPPHRPTGPRPRRLPKIGGIERNGCLAGRNRTRACYPRPAHRIAGRAGYRSWMRIVLVVVAAAEVKPGEASRLRPGLMAGSSLGSR
jgi:hypothetical protein